MFSVPRLFLLIAGIVLILCGSAVFPLLYLGPTKNVPTLSETKSSNVLSMFSRKTYYIEMMTCSAFAIFIGALALVAAFLDTQHKIMCILVYVLLFPLILVSVGMMILYGFSYFWLLTSSDNQMASQLSNFEAAFKCCGWKTTRPFPPCNSIDGYETGNTCYKNTQVVRSASLQGFITGGVYLVLSIIIV
ncbi:hypothetical protein EIN_227240, partial [Entamoeba invadens IP1]